MSELIEALSKRLKDTFDPQALADMLAEGVLTIGVALAVVVAFGFLWRLVNLVIHHSLKSKMDMTSYSFVEAIVKYSLLAIGVITALDSAGIKTSALLTSLGIAGLTIGFAARDALSNLISGILIYIDRPFVLGDLVEIDGRYGRVDRITLRSTRIVTPDGRMLAVPNTEIINKTVASYTNVPHLRIDIGVTVGVNEDLDNVRRLLLSLVEQDSSYMTEPAPTVVVTALNDYNVAIGLQAWIYDERLHGEKRYELREKVFKVLTRSGVEMPFETIQLQPIEVRSQDSGPVVGLKQNVRDEQ